MVLYRILLLVILDMPGHWMVLNGTSTQVLNNGSMNDIGSGIFKAEDPVSMISRIKDSIPIKS